MTANVPALAAPVKWGPGKGDYEHGVLIGAVPGGVLVPLPPWAKELAPQGEIPCEKSLFP